MGVEQETSSIPFQSLADRNRHPKAARPGIVKRAAASAFLTLVLPRAERITNHTKVEYQRGFENVFCEYVAEGYFPILYSNHTSYYDGFSLSLVADDLTNVVQDLLSEEGPFRGFVMPVATSLATGHQDYFAKRLYEASARRLAKRHLITFLLTRDKDKSKYGLSGNLREYIESLKYAIRGNFGLAIFPEGNRNGGRRNEDLNINGMVPFEKDALPTLVRHLVKERKKPMLIPVGISGSYKVLPPDKFPSREALRAGFGFRDPHLVDVKVGYPIRYEDLPSHNLEQDKKTFNDLLGGKVAELLPTEERGIYKTTA